jgi:metallophosphoesterase (TIGR00282 family)
MINCLFIGDIVGRPGRAAVKALLPTLKEAHALDFVIANGENAAGGAGITRNIADELHRAGVDMITLGDHTWDQRGFDREIGLCEGLCRPANLPESCPGRNHLIVEKNGFRLAVFTVLGRQYLAMKGDCPFVTSDDALAYLKGQCDAVVVEVHAEATSEKIALGWYLDGRAALVVGTHTHVPTADETVLPRGTAYLTDAGMTGPYTSVLGREIQPVIGRFLDGMPRRFPVASGDVRLSGCLVRIDPATGLATGCERLMLTHDSGDSLEPDQSDESG